MTKSIAKKIGECLTFRNIRFLYMLPPFTRHIRRCPVCNSSKKTLEFVNRYTPLDRCGDCGHVYSRKVPKKRILHLMYGDIAYWEQDKHHQGITAIARGPHWDEYLNARLGICERAGILGDAPPKTIFEIGCSEGMLLSALAERGHDARGCEMNVPTAEAGMRELDVNIDTDLFENIPLKENAYDAVLSFHTIEHIADLHRVFEKIASILKPDGSLLFEVPTGPEEYINTDHLQFFEASSIERLIRHYFEEAEVISNQYTNTHGTHIGSLYGVGRRPLSRWGWRCE